MGSDRLLAALDEALAALRELQLMQGGQRTKWAEADRQLLREFYPDTPAWMLAQVLNRSERSVHGQANAMGLRKGPGWVDNPLSRSTRVEPHRGRAGRFQAGQKPWNKGKKGWAAPGCERTQFKPGNKPWTTQPVGSYRLDKQGLLQRKIGEQSGPTHLRWRCVHELVWIRHHGPLPPGHVVVFKLGQRTNQLSQITIDRLECISRAELMRRNGYYNRYPKNIARLIQLQGALTRKINQRTQNRD